MDWNEWGPPVVAALVGIVGGVALWRWSRPTAAEQGQVRREGATVDLLETEAATIEALRALEAERTKMDPATYAAEREALLKRGAGALRALDDPSAGPASADPGPIGLSAQAIAVLDAERARLGPAAFSKAVADRYAGATEAPALAPHWVGALYALGVVAVGATLWFMAGSESMTRNDGGMTGRGAGGSAPAAAPAAAQQDPAIELTARVEKDPRDLEALNRLTELSISREDMQGALAWNNKALEVAPEDLDARVNRAILQVTIGMHDKAIEQLDEVLAVKQDHLRANVYRGLLAMNAGDFPKAVETLERASALTGGTDPFLTARVAEARQGAGMAPAAPSAAGAVAAGTVRIPLELATKLAGTETLYLAVKDPKTPGPPLAAVKLPATDFPRAFVVSPQDILPMWRGRPLPAELELVVRIDVDGDPMTKDDLASTTLTLAPGAADLMIDLK